MYNSSKKIFFLIYILTFLCSCRVKHEKIVQISTIDALLNGIYDGETSIAELKKYGDTGIGTFNSLDGEMIALNGQFYQIKSNGVAYLADNLKTPCAFVTFFETDKKLQLASGMSFEAFTSKMDSIIPTKNIFYAIKIEGEFKSVKTRSVPRQEKPYKKFVEVAKTQPIFDFKNVKGVMVGFRCPPFVKGINVPGYHLHFLTKNKKAGGHVLSFEIANAVLKIDETRGFTLLLPKDKEFYNTNLFGNKEKELEEAEKLR